MGKRKSREHGEGDLPHHKRQKKHDAQSTTNQTEHGSSLPIADLPEPPPGLSKGQRKRWRRQQRKKLKKELELKTNPPEKPRKVICNTLRFSTNWKESGPVIATERPLPVDQSMILRYGTTHLLAMPKKRWHDYRASHSEGQPRTDPEKLDKHNVVKAADERRPERNVTTADPGRSSTNISSLASTSLPLVKTTQSMPSSFEPPISTNRKQSSTLLENWPFRSTSDRRSFFGQNPTSIPDHSDITDVAASFERFTAFLRGEDSESSDDIDEDSESNVSDSNPRWASGADRRLLFEPTQRRLQAALHRSETRQPSQEQIGSLEQRGPATPTFALATSSPNSRRANMGIKRQIPSPASRQDALAEAADPLQTAPAPEKADATFDSSVLPFSTHLSVGDDEGSEDLYRTIDEISNDIFSMTRPLPACKSPVSPDLIRKRDQEHGLMTSPSSDRRVTRSMLAAKGHGKIDTRGISAPEDTAVVCQSVRVPDVRLSPVQQSQPKTTEDGEQPPGTLAPVVDTNSASNNESGSSLSELGPTPSPAAGYGSFLAGNQTGNDQSFKDDVSEISLSQDILDVDATPLRKKRKMTGMTSKHFTPERRKLRKRQSAPVVIEGGSNVQSELSDIDNEGQPVDIGLLPPAQSTRSAARKQRKGTGRKSAYFTPPKAALDPNIIDRVDFYNTTAGHRNKAVRRVPAGTSTAPVPPITSDRFGIIQEKLWPEPFWLLIAVTFLNKTTGRAAVPVFWALKEQYRTPEGLAAAPQVDLEDMIWHLGLQRQRSRRLIKMAKAWIEAPPEQGTRWRTLHYPAKDDGKTYKPAVVVTEDATDCAGALEIGHIPGCGPYAWDSWRIFCRDVLRGVAHDYNGSEADVERFEPEWKRVLPGDKELRACLRWMWLREGWIWDCETGEKREATAEEMERAMVGEMEFADEKEREFAAKAAGAEIETLVRDDEVLDGDLERSELKAETSKEAVGKAPPELESSAEDNIVVSPVTPSRTGLRRSARLTA